MRALPLALLLAACAAPAPPPASYAPNPDAGGVGLSECHLVTAAQYEAAAKSSVATTSAGAIRVTTSSGSVSCRPLDDGGSVCDVRGEGWVRAETGGQVRHFHVPAGELAMISRVGGAPRCRAMPIELP